MCSSDLRNVTVYLPIWSLLDMLRKIANSTNLEVQMMMEKEFLQLYQYKKHCWYVLLHAHLYLQ